MTKLLRILHIWPKKVVLFPDIDPGKNFLIMYPTELLNMYQIIYFQLQKNKKIKIKQEDKKQKKLKKKR